MQSTYNYRSAQPPARRPGFTLVEVLISLVLVLIILLGVNYIFHTASDAVAAGQTLDEFSRDQETAQTVMSNDFRNAMAKPPFFEIVARYCAEFLNQDDAQQTVNEGNAVTTGVSTISQNNQGQIASTPIPIINYRRHRSDLIRFFATGDYRRTTGDTGQFISGDGSNVAMITYAHAAVPTSSMPWVYWGPLSTEQMSMAATTQGFAFLKPPNYYAADWAIARNAVLLKDPNAISADGEVGYYARQNAGPTPQYNLPYDPPYTPNGLGTTAMPYTGAGIPYNTNLTPLAYDSPDNVAVANGGGTLLQSSRYDLAGVTLEQYRRYVADAYRDYRGNYTTGGSGVEANNYCTGHYLWWSPVGYNADWYESIDPATPEPITNVSAPPTAGVYAPPVNYWHGQPALICQDGNDASHTPEGFTGFYGELPTDDVSRFQANPQLVTPLSSASFAQLTPYLIEHCSQFVVEYAGDYLQQNANGDLTGIGADGQIDFIVDPNGNKRIRWYGAPRSTHNNLLHSLVNALPSTGATTAFIRGYDDGTNNVAPLSNASKGDNYATPGLLNDYSDVVPLGDYYSLYLHMLSPLSGSEPNAYNQPNYLVAAPGSASSINYPIYTSGYGSTPNLPGLTGYYADTTNVSAGMAHPTWEYQDFPTQADYGTNWVGRSPNYIAVWRNDAPMLVRILIKVDDPNDKVKSGPWYEYVFRIK